MYFDINSPRLRADIRALSAQIRGLKRALGSRWQQPMADLQRELHRLKGRATELCALSAYARGRLHLQRAPRGAPPDWSAAAYHQRIAERLGPSYSLALRSFGAALEQSA
jgi:hypothetical protein